MKRILVIDVESTCWEPKSRSHVAEIIEIGYQEVFPNRRRAEGGFLGPSGSFYIIPQVGDVSEFCTQLTGLTAEFLSANGSGWEDSLKAFRKQLNPNNALFCSWGDYDRKMFEHMSTIYNTPYPMGPHLNLKSVFAAKFGVRAGVSKALEMMGMDFVGRPHSGKDDAHNIARLLGEVLEINGSH